MATTQIQPGRILLLNDREPDDGDYVLYWMQQSQRAESNPALEYAIQLANDLKRPLLVVFGLMDDYPEANLRHYRFMIEGLAKTQQALRRRNIRLAVVRGHPANVAQQFGRDAASVVCDVGYVRHQRQWREQLAQHVKCRVVAVDADSVVPVLAASDKAEYAARTIRPKINRQLDEYLVELRTTAVEKKPLSSTIDELELADVDAVTASLKVDRSVTALPHVYPGGTVAAKRFLATFVKEGLPGYDEKRKSLDHRHVTLLGPYLHFGQISAVDVALAVRQARSAPQEGRDSFLEELCVRRGLAQNFVWFNNDYDKYRVLPDWAQKTLAKHRDDKRERAYTAAQLEAGKTHDHYWNMAMQEMRATGYLHNHLRMYWGKKILEWCNTPEHAFATALALNNKYFLDGRDANSFANIAWVFGVHDRPWKEREIFGTVRYMAASGLERKTDIEGWMAAAQERIKEAEQAAE